MGGLWSPGKLPSQRSSWVPSNRGGGDPGGSWPRGLWAGSEEGLGSFVQPANPPESMPWCPPSLVLASLCHQFAVGFCAKSLSSLGMFPQLSYRKPGPVPLESCGHSAGNEGMKNPGEAVRYPMRVQAQPPAGARARAPGLASHQGSALVQCPLPSRSALPPSVPPSLPSRSAGSRHAVRC